MRYVYPALLACNELGGYNASFPDFDVVTQGDDIDNAVEMAAEALWLIIDDHFERGKPLPKPVYETVGEGLVVAVSVDVDASKALVSPKKAAEMLHVSDARVRQMVCSGQLAAKKQGRDNYVYAWSVKERIANPPKTGRPKNSPEAPAPVPAPASAVQK